MLTTERKSLLLDRLRRDGRIIAKALSEELSLSEDTIRRDLRELAAEGKLTRVHGGALPASPTVVNMAGRRQRSNEEKQRLGAKGASLIAPRTSIFLDGGTTNLAIVEALPLDFAGTITTHSPTIAAALERHVAAEVILIGGRLYHHSMVALGASALEMIERLRFDQFFLGVTGVHASEGLTTGDFEEAAIKRAIAARAAETIVLATAEKLGTASPHRIAALGEVTTLVTTGELANFHPQGGRPRLIKV